MLKIFFLTIILTGINNYCADQVPKELPVDKEDVLIKCTYLECDATFKTEEECIKHRADVHYSLKLFRSLNPQKIRCSACKNCDKLVKILFKSICLDCVDGLSR
jgi:hypothetical protein